MKWPADLVELLSMELPTPKIKNDGFMDIVDSQFHENTITRVYAYFLNSNKDKGVAALFLDSLLRIISTKSEKRLEFGNHVCQLERQTDNGNRIDLLIKTGNQTIQTDDYAIIIENKIFSPVKNDLTDYWNTVKVNDERKVGVLLTLTPTQIPAAVQKYFINITHSEWVGEIKSAGLPHNLETRLYVYLNDFIMNMDNIVTLSEGLGEEAQFFFEHPSKILRAIKTYEAAWSHIINQLRMLSEKLGLSLYGNSGSWRHVWDFESHVYYAIGFDQTMKPDPTIAVYLEVYKDGISRYEELHNKLLDGGFYGRLQDDHKHNQSWAHLAYKEYPLTIHNIENLSTYLNQKILEDFNEAYELVINALRK